MVSPTWATAHMTAPTARPRRAPTPPASLLAAHDQHDRPAIQSRTYTPSEVTTSSTESVTSSLLLARTVPYTHHSAAWGALADAALARPHRRQCVSSGSRRNPHSVHSVCPPSRRLGKGREAATGAGTGRPARIASSVPWSSATTLSSSAFVRGLAGAGGGRSVTTSSAAGVSCVPASGGLLGLVPAEGVAARISSARPWAHSLRRQAEHRRSPRSTRVRMPLALQPSQKRISSPRLGILPPPPRSRPSVSQRTHRTFAVRLRKSCPRGGPVGREPPSADHAQHRPVGPTRKALRAP